MAGGGIKGSRKPAGVLERPLRSFSKEMPSSWSESKCNTASTWCTSSIMWTKWVVGVLMWPSHPRATFGLFEVGLAVDLRRELRAT